MSIKPTKTEPKFTYEPLTKQDLLNLVGAGPYKACKITQPKQCKGNVKDPDLQKQCHKVFRQCVIEAQRFEAWHRMN